MCFKVHRLALCTAVFATRFARSGRVGSAESIVVNRLGPSEMFTIPNSFLSRSHFKRLYQSQGLPWNCIKFLLLVCATSIKANLYTTASRTQRNTSFLCFVQTVIFLVVFHSKHVFKLSAGCFRPNGDYCFSHLGMSTPVQK